MTATTGTYSVFVQSPLIKNSSGDVVVNISTNTTVVSSGNGSTYYSLSNGLIDVVVGSTATMFLAPTYTQFLRVYRNRVFANLAAINAEVTIPSAGDECYVTGQGKAVYNGTTWVKCTDETTAIT